MFHQEAKQQCIDIINISAMIFKNYDEAQPYEGVFRSAHGFDKPLFMQMTVDREMILYVDHLEEDGRQILTDDMDWKDLVGMLEDLEVITSAKAEALREMPV